MKTAQDQVDRFGYFFTHRRQDIDNPVVRAARDDSGTLFGSQNEGLLGDHAVPGDPYGLPVVKTFLSISMNGSTKVISAPKDVILSLNSMLTRDRCTRAYRGCAPKDATTRLRGPSVRGTRLSRDLFRFHTHRPHIVEQHVFVLSGIEEDMSVDEIGNAPAREVALISLPVVKKYPYVHLRNQISFPLLNRVSAPLKGTTSFFPAE